MTGQATTVERGQPAAAWRTRLTWLLAVVAATGFAALLASLIIANQRANASRDAATGWQLHTYQVMLAAERLQSTMFDAQRSRRGYILNDSRDASLLIPYHAAIARVPGELAELRRLTGDNANQQTRLAWITGLVQSQIARMEDMSTATRQGAGVVKGGSSAAGEVNVTQIRVAIASLVGDEQRLLDERNARVRAADIAVKDAARSLSISGLMLLALALITGYLAVTALLRARRAVAEAGEADRARQVLETAVALRTQEIEAARANLENQIARRDAAESQVRQMQKLESVGQLTGGIAHDFNNMLAIVIGSLDLALRRLNDPEGRVKKYVDNAMDGAKRAASLTARLLAFSRQQALAPEPIDANTFVSNISELLRRTLGEGIQIETVLAGGLWRTYADASELENAIVNLAVNARDAMEGRGKLTVETNNTHLDDAYAREHADVGAGQYVVICVDRHGRRDAAGGHRQGLRSVLHDQDRRQGHRPRAEPGLWFRQAVGRTREDLF